MKKKIFLIVFFSMLFGGVVSAASLWGSYKGNQIIRLTVDGVPVKVSDVPAISYNGRTMIPIYLLQQAGIQYQWDGKNQTVNILSHANPAQTELVTPKTMTAKEISNLMDRVGFIEAYDNSGRLVGTGSGFIINGGWFITNSHVGRSNSLKVKIDGHTYDTNGWNWFDNPSSDVYGTFLSTSYGSDGTVTGTMPSKTLNYTTTLPEIGDKVFLIGSPKGFENSITEGIVSGIRKEGDVTFIQHTAATEGGSSGGALLNEHGEVIGLHSWVLSDGTSLKFAVPMQYVQHEIDYLVRQK